MQQYSKELNVFIRETYFTFAINIIKTQTRLSLTHTSPPQRIAKNY